jgi:hypothetical protein
MRAVITAGSLVALGFALVAAAPGQSSADSLCCVATTLYLHAEPTTAPATKPDAKKAFEEISKAVVGKWKLVLDEGMKEPMSGETEFKLTAAGSVIMETMLPGTQMEMVNLFAIDNDDLLVTHYCASGNQPRMRLVSAEGGVYTFEFIDGTNISPDAEYMGGLKITIAGEKVIEDWTSFLKNKPTSTMHLPLGRQ